MGKVDINHPQWISTITNEIAYMLIFQEIWLVRTPLSDRVESKIEFLLPRERILLCFSAYEQERLVSGIKIFHAPEQQSQWSLDQLSYWNIDFQSEQHEWMGARGDWILLNRLQSCADYTTVLPLFKWRNIPFPLFEVSIMACSISPLYNLDSWIAYIWPECVSPPVPNTTISVPFFVR